MDTGVIFMSKMFSSDNPITGYFIKAIITSIVTTVAFCLGFSLLILKFDLNDLYYDIFSCITICLSALVTSYISVSKFKNNLFVMSVLSNILLLIATIINLIVNKKIILSVIEVAIIILSSFISAQLVLRKNRGYSI